MSNILVGQEILITAAVWDFCSTTQQALFVNEVGIDHYATQDPSIACLNVSGIGVTFMLVGTSGSIQCTSCTPAKIYSTLGTVTTNSVGIASISHKVTTNDLNAYTDSVTKGTNLRIIACITAPKGQSVLSSQCSDNVVVYQALQPTHYINLSLGFVPPQLASYFQTYIVDISEQLFTQIAYPPAPWIYVKTTYDPVQNAFNIWFYLPPTMSPDPLSDLFTWHLAWVGALIGVLLLILVIVTGGAAIFGIGGLYILIASAVILSSSLYVIYTGTIALQNAATNALQQLSNVNKENQGKTIIDKTWSASAKVQADCLNRLTSYMNLHNSAIDGNVNTFGKHANLVTSLNAEKASFTTSANSIITLFKAATYTVDVCNTFYSNLDSLVTASNVRIATLISQNAPPGEGYSPTCAGWSNQANCEQNECYWYNGTCHVGPNCWISNPLGGCILSAGTGTLIVGIIAVAAIGGAALWLLTRYPKETRTIVTGAQGAVTGAYRRFLPSLPPPPQISPASNQAQRQFLSPPAPT
jgi:hypothetical protein